MPKKLDLKKSIITLQFAEKFKSELIIASRLLIEISDMRNEDLLGAQKMLKSFFSLLNAEIIIGYQILKDENFNIASKNLQEVINKSNQNDFQKATKIISKAISNVTTSSQRAMQTLIEAKLF